MHVSASKAIRDAAAEGKQKLDLFETEICTCFLSLDNFIFTVKITNSLSPLWHSLFLSKLYMYDIIARAKMSTRCSRVQQTRRLRLFQETPAAFWSTPVCAVVSSASTCRTQKTDVSWPKWRAVRRPSARSSRRCSARRRRCSSSQLKNMIQIGKQRNKFSLSLALLNIIYNRYLFLFIILKYVKQKISI